MKHTENPRKQVVLLEMKMKWNKFEKQRASHFHRTDSGKKLNCTPAKATDNNNHNNRQRTVEQMSTEQRKNTNLWQEKNNGPSKILEKIFWLSRY